MSDLLYQQASQGCTPQAALQRQDLSCLYLAHHELQRVLIHVIVIIYIYITVIIILCIVVPDNMHIIPLLFLFLSSQSVCRDSCQTTSNQAGAMISLTRAVALGAGTANNIIYYPYSYYDFDCCCVGTPVR